MKQHKVYALGRDTYWLEAVVEAAGEDVPMERIECPDDYPLCLERLPAADAQALLLVDATRQADVVELARQLGVRGWRHIVVVAADPTSKEARAVLRDGLAHDYWRKSYERQVIRRHLEQCLEELEGMSDEPDHHLVSR
jgi:hypothetical protein